ncbi:MULTISPECIES: superoxide dismutase family protein [unclassified Luteibacter]|uniref:superoxide dismutase family protein n=1 Tax=unclassified Luteibacter TaxID=2620188 RepID=UPI0008C8E0DD|nr:MULTISPECIES: superoxide dismutase family protein [unclassified Luteibacter]MDR6936073.1 Cu-Zn family superoxide dismutase [Luteibacter sp. 3190]SEO54660.1 superoxide dismutase, Cu-Zn family [Luteibacter sp. UNC138MFCol5.1]SEV88956.1 superoxide dismutase, Cu-Zn family [Luteibacter sp. 329MFSha]
MKRIAVALAGLVVCVAAQAAEKSVVVPLTLVTADGAGASVGKVTVTESAGGLVFTPDLKGLPPGEHGFHLHEKPSCAPGEKDGKKGAALAAGGHYDPNKTGKHEGPDSTAGHEGDLPKITVGADGTDTTAVTAPNLKSLATLKGHALMIHAGGDNYSDKPEALGGGGARIACGVVK